MNYEEYYLKCLEKNHKPNDCVKILYDFGLSLKKPENFSKDYIKHVSSLSKNVNTLFKTRENYMENNMCQNLINIFNLKEIESITQIVAPYLEEHIYNCPIHLDRVYIYRNKITNKKPETSWLWHWDHHPKEIIKILIYLVDVDENTGPFEYISKGEECIKMETNRLGIKTWGTKNPPGYPNSRLSEKQIQDYVDKGCKTIKILGKQGTTIVFDNNIIHRANIPKDKIRDVLVLQFKPCMEKRTIYFDKKTTGTFSENAVTKDPSRFVI